jgi:uncharacterized protein
VAARITAFASRLRSGQTQELANGELELTGWRRTVAELYAAVRAEEDLRRGHELWRRRRDELFRSHPQSPLPPGDPLRTTGVPYWPYDPQLRFELPLLPPERELSLSVPASEGVTPMDRIGCVRLPAPLNAVIDVWWLRQYAGGLLLPLRDVHVDGAVVADLAAETPQLRVVRVDAAAGDGVELP